ncbi:nitroreductase family protein [Lentisphaerota bacterium WC36G]|nr:nitroreductase family protein [Lentisphaerae bacterium WC36]
MNIANNETLKSIVNRRSVRHYREDQLTDEEVKIIVRAGIYAPSAYNKQEWFFTVVQNPVVLKNLNDAAKQVASTSSDPKLVELATNDQYNIFYNAPTVVIVSGKKNGLTPIIDSALASQNMMLAAQSMNIASCWVGIVTLLFDSIVGEDYRQILNIPAAYSPHHAISFGYADNPNLEPPRRNFQVINFIK